MINIAINGFGRIGRNIVRAIVESNSLDQFKLVAINDLGAVDVNAHLLQYDTTHGRFIADIESDDKSIILNGKVIPAYRERDPTQLPWAELDVDIVFECTGFFRNRREAEKHLHAGAKKVLVSAPGKGGLDAMVVYGVNHQVLKPGDQLVSNASCTTNCLAHIAKLMNDTLGIESGLANTIHAYTSTQNLLDSYHKDMRRARAANYSMIPTTTGSARAIGKVVPGLEGKLDAVSVRVPTLNVSLLDFTFIVRQSASADEINDLLIEHARKSKGIVAINSQPLVSIDFNHHPASCIVDIDQTSVKGNLVKLLAWYDNEWGYCNRMLDVAAIMAV